MVVSSTIQIYTSHTKYRDVIRKKNNIQLDDNQQLTGPVYTTVIIFYEEDEPLPQQTEEVQSIGTQRRSFPLGQKSKKNIRM